MELSSLPKNSSFIRFKNRCVITGRGRSISRFLRISRLVFREFARDGKISGLTKSS